MIYILFSYNKKERKRERRRGKKRERGRPGERGREEGIEGGRKGQKCKYSSSAGKLETADIRRISIGFCSRKHKFNRFQEMVMSSTSNCVAAVPPQSIREKPFNP